MSTEKDLGKNLSDTDGQEDDALMPDGVDEALEQSISDPDARRHVKQAIVHEFGMIAQISPQTGLMKKITSDHITEYLKIEEKSLDYSFKDSKQSKYFFLLVLLIVSVVLIMIIHLLKDSNPDQMERLITILVSGALGASGGFGLGYKKGKDDN